MASSGLPYYIGYHMIIESLKEDGYTNALDLVRTYLSADGCKLFRENEDKEYELFSKERTSEKDLSFIKKVLNDICKKIEKKDFINIDFSINEKNDSNLLFIPFRTKNNRYILIVSNNKRKDEKELFVFAEIVKNSLAVVLDKQEEYEIAKKNSLIDSLTGLNNVRSYEEMIEKANKTNRPYTYALLDLFRLKYVNDNISHVAGDIYIKETARILEKHFPRYDKDKKETDTYIYRIGGDEYVVISFSMDIFEVEDEIKLAQEEVRKIVLDSSKPPLGLNYGIVFREGMEDANKVKEKADKLLSNNKREMYSSYGLDRRR